MTDLPSFMSADPAEAEDLHEGQPAPVQEQQDPPANPGGAPAPQPAGEAQPAAPADPNAPAAPQGQGGAPAGFVPLATFLDMRDRANSLAKQIPQPKAEEPPDEYEDPVGFQAYQQRKQDERFGELQQQRTVDRLDFSERLTRLAENNDQLVDTAKRWAFETANTDPRFKQAIVTHADPYKFIVTEYRRAQAYQAVQDPATFEAFKAWQAAQTGGGAPPSGHPTPTPAAPAARPQNPAPPRPSIAGAPSAAGPSAPVVRTGEDTYNRMFAR